MFKIIFKKKPIIPSIMLKEFLNIEVLPEDITYNNTIISPSNIDVKVIINDVKFDIPDGSVIFMEMQNDYKDVFLRRVEYYMAKLMVDIMSKGFHYSEMVKIYGIFFINTDDANFSKLFTKFSNYDILNSVEGYYNWVFINLKYRDESRNLSKDLSSILKLMGTDDEMEMSDLSEKSNVTKEVFDEMKKVSTEKEYRDILFTIEKQENDERNRLHEAKIKGIEHGIEQGIEVTKKNIILELYNSNLDFDFISNIVKLPIDQVSKIIENNK